jgi:hypothetical protein
MYADRHLRRVHHHEPRATSGTLSFFSTLCDLLQLDGFPSGLDPVATHDSVSAHRPQSDHHSEIVHPTH